MQTRFLSKNALSKNALSSGVAQKVQKTRAAAKGIRKTAHSNACTHTCSVCGIQKGFASELKRHMLSHGSHDCAKHACAHCPKRFKYEFSLKRHEAEVHVVRTLFRCDDCSATFHQRAKFYAHRDEHRGIFLNCSVCGLKFSTPAVLERHARIHTGEKNFACSRAECAQIPCVDPYCEHAPCKFRAFRSDHVKRHVEAVHSTEGKQRRLKKQSVVRNMLTFHDIPFDEEVTIDVERCGMQDDRSRARLDFQLLQNRDGGHAVILEVDENQHSLTCGSVSCDVKRMVQVRAATLLAGDERPLLWIRYNPDAFKVDGVTRKGITRHVRHRELLHAIRTAKVPESAGMAVLYLWYDRDLKGVPCVTKDPEYDSSVAELVLPWAEEMNHS